MALAEKPPIVDDVDIRILMALAREGVFISVDEMLNNSEVVAAIVGVSVTDVVLCSRRIKILLTRCLIFGFG